MTWSITQPSMWRWLGVVFCGLPLLISCSDNQGVKGNVDALITPNNEIATQTYLDQPPFADVTDEVGLDFEHSPFLSGEFYMPEIMGAGVALLDYDNDGDQDVYLVQGAPFSGDSNVQSDQLFKNNFVETGSLSFTNVTKAVGISATGYGMGVAVADYDQDGFVDLFVSNFGQNQLWRNKGNGTFEEVAERTGIRGDEWSSSAAFVDFDGDGDADLFVANYVNFQVQQNYACTSEGGQADYCGPQTYRPMPDKLYENTGNGKFKDISVNSGINRAYGPGLGIAISDFDNNGHDDIYVANDGEPNQLWMNSGHGSFTENGLMSGTALNADGASEAGMGVTAADVDNDGDDDLFMTHLIAETNTLYINSGSGQFYDATSEVNLAASSIAMTGFGASWLDFDQDGWLDLFVANGNVKLETSRIGKSEYPFEQRNQLFKNLGRQNTANARVKFVDVSEEVPAVFAPLEVSRGVAVGDLNNDCFEDILMTNNNGRARVLSNQLSSANWLGISLQHSAHHFIEGTKVVFSLNNKTEVVRVARRTGSYLSAHDPRLCFVWDEDESGKENSTSGPEIRVEWPNGAHENWSNLAANKYHVLSYGEGVEAPRAAP